MKQPHTQWLPSFRNAPGLLPAIGVSVAALIVSLLPLLLHGFAMGHDWSLELVRIAEFRHAIQDGQWPPYWASNLYQGFGSPIFLFYPPLYLAVAAAFVACGFGLMQAAVGALCVFSVIGALLMWRFVRAVSPASPAAAATAVVLFSLNPYLLADKWIRNANAEFAALSLLPGVLLGATAADPLRRFWWTAIPLALVVLSHNIVALVALTLALGIASVVHRTVRALLPVVAGVIAALAMTAFFWLPAFVLQPLIRTEDLLSGKFDFHQNFPNITALLWPVEFYFGGWIWPILLAVLTVAPKANQTTQRIARAFGIGAIACLALMLPLSTWIGRRCRFCVSHNFRGALWGRSRSWWQPASGCWHRRYFDRDGRPRYFFLFCSSPC
ncbi:MAG TPA: hypothetical protein VK993_15945 [Chthoniobacterales bacterium]|nr:hypothetical protein [Chthoniobacterales bacterium]